MTDKGRTEEEESEEELKEVKASIEYVHIKYMISKEHVYKTYINSIKSVVEI